MNSLTKVLLLSGIYIISLSNSFGQEDSLKLKKERSFFKIIWGSQVESSIVFEPTATHTIRPDFFATWYTGYSYKGLEGAVFLNSYRDWTGVVLYKRAWKFKKRFSIIPGAGLLYGYKGRLHNIHNIWITNNFLFAWPVNPVAGLELDYKVSKKIALRIDIVPLVVLYGFRYTI